MVNIVSGNGWYSCRDNMLVQRSICVQHLCQQKVQWIYDASHLSVCNLSVDCDVTTNLIGVFKLTTDLSVDCDVTTNLIGVTTDLQSTTFLCPIWHFCG